MEEQVLWWIIGILVSLAAFLLGFIIHLIKPSYLKMGTQISSLIVEVRTLVATLNERESKHQELNRTIEKRLNAHSDCLKIHTTDIAVIKARASITKEVEQ